MQRGTEQGASSRCRGTRIADGQEEHGRRDQAAGNEMLDAYVIEEIKRRERGKERDERPSLDLPLPTPGHERERDRERRRDDDEREDDRGVVIIDYSGG
jgi:hypothetical protein